MKVYLDDDVGRRLIGRADVPEDAGPVFEAPMFGVVAPLTLPPGTPSI